MLPHRKSEHFPKALKELRESLKISHGKLAKLCNISRVMPKRYEEVDAEDFASPNEATWNALNNALEIASIEFKRNKIVTQELALATTKPPETKCCFKGVQTIWQPVIPFKTKYIVK